MRYVVPLQLNKFFVRYGTVEFIANRHTGF